jgi:acyl transferase domain-containing protein
MTNSKETGLEIAVIGMSGKFPGAKNLKEFWENLKNDVESISNFSTEELRECGISEHYLENPNYIKAYGVVEDKAYFDSSFFGYSPREAQTMDPLIRLFHECSWEALEDAGYDPISYNDSIGIYAGSSDGFGWQVVKTLKNLNTQSEDTGLHMTENPLLLSTYISHKLNLRGPSITLFTACSTGLVAIHTACRALLTGECHIALAGVGSVLATEKGGYIYQEGMIMSPDGHCRPFDANAQGTIYGDGIGIVVLKRLKHALVEKDNIKAIIKASALIMMEPINPVLPLPVKSE